MVSRAISHRLWSFDEALIVADFPQAVVVRKKGNYFTSTRAVAALQNEDHSPEVRDQDS